ncbi:hypothetical protein FOXYS1_10527 [Fusarium oxysporum]|uniref:Uncharacterized protein n=2 Tax=Fusarium oxysporum TaxID=5507 RepID=A0A8H5A4Z2_FUSOX|nr:hypothetical protein FOXYS1_10527 [Fusarium oxysporum]
MEEHMKRKDIENRLIYPPYKPDATDHWQRTPQEIQEHITQLMTQRAKIDTAERDTLPGMEEKESNKRTNHWFKFIKQQAAALAEEGMERSYGVLSDDDDTGTICMHEDCSHPRLYRVLYCSVHILSHTVSGSTKACKPEHQGFVSQQLQTPGNWKIDKSSNFEPFLNRQKLSAKSRFFALDIEGYISRKPSVVEQAAAVSIDSINGEDGKILFNVNIKGPSVDQGSKQYPTAANQDFATNLLKFGTQDYWQYNKETLSGERVDLMRAVAIIQDSGITCQDYVVVWHKNYADVRALRHLFSRTGIQDILPPDDHVIRLNYLFRHNLNIPKGMMCSLELLFSIVFPLHPLRFTHHDALIDSRKTVLMALFAEKLCKGEYTTTIRGLGL